MTDSWAPLTIGRAVQRHDTAANARKMGALVSQIFWLHSFVTGGTPVDALSIFIYVSGSHTPDSASICRRVRFQRQDISPSSTAEHSPAFIADFVPSVACGRAGSGPCICLVDVP